MTLGSTTAPGARFNDGSRPQAQSAPEFVDAASCYWGTDDEDTIESRIIDSADSAGKLDVVFRPYLLEPHWLSSDTSASPGGDLFWAGPLPAGTTTWSAEQVRWSTCSV